MGAMPTDDERVRKVGRRLRDLVEPIAANVYFCPEAQEQYRTLGIENYAASYFCSRGGCMGQVPGEVVVAAFGVFNPALVIPAVDEGWSKTDARSIVEARRQGATAALERILGGVPGDVKQATALLRRAGDAATGEGRPLYSGLRSLDWPGDPLGDLWRAADLVREHRGDSHVAAWVSHGVDAVEINLLTELWWRLPLNTYVRTRGWSEGEIDAALARLRDRGLVDGAAFTAEGEALRASIEQATDRGERRIVEALGDDADELFSLLQPWATTIVESGGYPRDPSQLTRR